jgi:hypothetical protein
VATASKDSRKNETKASGLLGSGVLTGDQSVLLSKIPEYIHGLDFPASKDDILKQAERNGADQTTLGSIKRVSERHYDSPAELLKEFGEG